MKTIEQAMRVVAGMAVLCGCASVQDEPAPAAAPAAMEEPSGDARSDAPGDAAGDVAPAPAKTVVEPIATVSATLEPPTLQLAYDGRCRDIGVSVVGAETFVHWMADYEKGVMHRVGPKVEMLDEIVFDGRIRDGEDETPPTGILDVGGRWPDDLWVVGDHSFRDFQATRLYARRDGKWTPSNVLGSKADFTRVWAWHDDSVLAFATIWGDDSDSTRLAVVRGRGKGPSFATVQGRAGCKGEGPGVLDVAVATDGHVAAVVQCDTTWLATWAPGDRGGRSVKIGGGDLERARVALDVDGRGWVSVGRGIRTWLHRFEGDTAEKAKLPSGAALRGFDLDAGGNPWLATSKGVYTRDGEDWALDGEATGVDRIEGAASGMPWILRDRELAMRTTDGAWHSIARPEGKSVPGKTPRVLDLVVVGPGDAFVVGEYFRIKKGTKHVGARFQAVMSTRAIATPRGC